MNLEVLRRTGARVGDSELPMTKPANFDEEKYRRGQRFFQENVFACNYAMLTSLVCGLSVENLLQPLVFTKQSGEPLKAIRRYMRTFQHVGLWHFQDIFDPESDAHKSVRTVRKQHNSVRNAMNSSKTDVNKLDNVSQYDMSLVQSGFVGPIIMYPRSCGIQCTEDDLDDFVYFWYCVGYLLGITDENNVCREGYQTAWKICKEIETDILYPAMCNPPSLFEPMAQALIDGMNHMLRFPLHSLNALVAATPSTVAGTRPGLSVCDRFRVLFLHLLVGLARCFPSFRNFLNRPFIGLIFAGDKALDRIG